MFYQILNIKLYIINEGCRKHYFWENVIFTKKAAVTEGGGGGGGKSYES